MNCLIISGLDICLTLNPCSIQCNTFFYLCSHIMSLFLVILPPCSLHKRRCILHMCHIHVHILRLASIWTFSRWSEALLHNNKPQAFLSDLALNWAASCLAAIFTTAELRTKDFLFPVGAALLWLMDPLSFSAWRCRFFKGQYATHLVTFFSTYC